MAEWEQAWVLATDGDVETAVFYGDHEVIEFIIYKEEDETGPRYEVWVLLNMEEGLDRQHLITTDSLEEAKDIAEGRHYLAPAVLGQETSGPLVERQPPGTNPRQSNPVPAVSASDLARKLKF